MKRLVLALVIWIGLVASCAASTIIVGTATHAAASGNANNAIPVPAGVINGDTLFMCFKLDSSVTVTTLGGTFTSCTNFASLVNVTASTYDMKCGCRTASSEPASYTPTWTGSAASIGVIAIVRNTDGTTPAIDVAPTTASDATNLASITTSTNNDLIVSMVLDATSGAGKIASVPNPMAMSLNIANAHVLYATQKTAGATTWIPQALGYSGAGTRLGITIAVKTNTTTAANLTGVGADSYNSGSAANVSPAIANNAALGDIMLASISEVTNTGIAVTIPTFNGTYSATGISYGQTTLVNSDAHTAVTLTGASTGQVTSTVPVAIGAQVAGTEECWVKIAGSTAGAFIMAGTGFTGWGIGVGNASWASAGTSFIGLVGSVAFVTFTGAPSMVAGTVYHVVAENDASNFFVWVNGTKYTGSNHGGSAPTSVLSLGEDNNSNYITATEQKCAYYDYELSATQIANHYLAGTTAPAGYAGAGVTGGATYDAVIQNDGPDVYWNLGESSGTTATNIGQMGLTWTQLPASAVVNESATISNSTYWAPAIGGHGHAQFNFGSNPAASDGIIADFGNINTTTPIDSSNSLVNQGLAASVSASLPAPTATDELVAVFQSYATCASPIASQATGTNYPQTIIGSGRASAYVMTADFASTWQLVDACTGPFASIAVGLSAATTPTRTTAQMRIQQQMESIFSLAPAPLPPGGSWFF